MRAYTFSIILYVDEKEKFAHALYCLNQAAGDEKIQLIVADPFADPQIAAACCDYKGGFAAYFELPDMQMAEAYQTGLAYVKGDYVNFALASSYFSKDALLAVHGAFQSYDGMMVSAAPYFAGEGNPPYDGSFHTMEKELKIRLLENKRAHSIQLLLQAYFIRREALEGMVFQSELQEDALYQFICELQLKFPAYLYLSKVKYYYTIPKDDTHAQDPMQYQYRWYEPSVRGFILPLLQSSLENYAEVPAFLQVECYYLINVKIRSNMYNRDKGVLKTKEEVQQFYDAVFEALTYIDNEVILQENITSYLKVTRSMRMYLLRGKAEKLGKRIKIDDFNGYFLAFLQPKGQDQDEKNLEEKDICLLGESNSETLKIQTINYKDGILQIDAYCELTDYLAPEEFEIFAERIENGVVTESYQPVYTEIYPQTLCFGITFHKDRSLQFQIPIKDKGKQTFRFHYACFGKEHQFNLNFSNYNARIYSNGTEPYWKFKKGWMLRPNVKKTELVIEECGRILQLKKELKFCRKFSRDKHYADICGRGIALRILYWLLLPFCRKRQIWVTFDKLYKAGDNGEYMFQYIRKNHRDIHIYYIIRKDSPDYKRLVREHHRHILVYGTMRCQLISLLATVILATHDELSNRYNPAKKYRSFTKDLQRGEVVCIQHGLTIQDIAQYQNRLRDNTKLYCCASKYEIQNISRPIYGYSDEQLKLTGLARYDDLKDRSQKVILITPTWRRNVAKTVVTDVLDRYNANFKDSTYFHIYNQLINDERLLDCAKKHGYRIVYLLHPVVSAQIDDFTHNGYVEFISGRDTDYEDILCESSLMVTDYSGVQFDFAYMRKPLIYYQPSSLPPHYEDGGMDYGTMGFGPICEEHEEVVDAICKAIESNCQMEEEYRKRADDFFAFDDHRNCERIFEAVREYQG